MSTRTKPASNPKPAKSVAVKTPSPPSSVVAVERSHNALRDQLDRDLLALLQANARASTADLARQLGTARTTVLARLSRMEREGKPQILHPFTIWTTMGFISLRLVITH